MIKFCFIFLYKTTIAKLYAIIKTSQTATEAQMAKIDFELNKKIHYSN